MRIKLNIRILAKGKKNIMFFTRIKRTTKTKTSRHLALTFKTLVHICAAIIAIAYVYLTFVSVFGLVLAILMGLGSLFVSIMVAYNTLKEKKSSTDQVKSLRKQEIRSKIFLGVAIPATLLSSASHAIAAFTSVIVLGPLLPLAIPFEVLIGLGVFFAVITAFATFMYDWIQALEVLDRISPSLFIDKGQSEQPLQSATIVPLPVAEPIAPVSILTLTAPAASFAVVNLAPAAQF